MNSQNGYHTDNENAQVVDKIEGEAEAPPLPEPPTDTGEICFDIVDNNNSLVSIYLYDADS